MTNQTQPPREPPKERTRQQVLRDALVQIQPAMKEVIPKHLTPERMTKIVLSAINRQPKLLECTIPSICRAVMDAAQLGLEIGGLIGEAYLVPYNVKIRGEDGQRDRWENQAQCIPGYRGLIKLARQSGEIATVMANVVYVGDKFSVDLAQDEISHIPNYDGPREDKDIRLVYCLVKFVDEFRQFDVMTRADVDKIRARSKSKDFGPWVSDYAEMAKKTVTRRLLKYVPISAEKLHRAMELDDRDAISTIGETVSDTTSPIAADVPVGIAALQEHLEGGGSAREQMGTEQTMEPASVVRSVSQTQPATQKKSDPPPPPVDKAKPGSTEALFGSDDQEPEPQEVSEFRRRLEAAHTITEIHRIVPEIGRAAKGRKIVGKFLMELHEIAAAKERELRSSADPEPPEGA